MGSSAENADEREKGFLGGGKCTSTHVSPGSNNLRCACSSRPSSSTSGDLELCAMWATGGKWFNGGVSSVSFEGYWTEDGSCAIVLGSAGTRYRRRGEGGCNDVARADWLAKDGEVVQEGGRDI